MLGNQENMNQNTHVSPKTPKVSIGLPVYNGENYICEAIDSILAQTFTDFELIITDNASSDRTPEICQVYAARDSRVKYYRSETNRGAAWNFNRSFQLSRGVYFKWIAHDDLITCDYLEKTVQVLDENPDVVLCSTDIQWIDESGAYKEQVRIPLQTNSPVPWRRFRDLLLVWHNCFEIFGLIRSSVLAQTPLIGRYSMGDLALLARLSLYGRFHKIEEFLFVNRWHKLQSNKVYLRQSGNMMKHHAYTLWFDPSRNGKIIMPQWEVFIDLFRMINKHRLSPVNWLMCFLFLGRWMLRYRKPLFEDIAIAVITTIQGLLPRSFSR
jgi:glycosyltransferase involved in cell wall biosynthesis